MVQAFIGFVIALAMHIKNGWWLDAGDRVREMRIVLGVAALVVSVWKVDLGTTGSIRVSLQRLA